MHYTEHICIVGTVSSVGTLPVNSRTSFRTRRFARPGDTNPGPPDISQTSKWSSRRKTTTPCLSSSRPSCRSLSMIPQTQTGNAITSKAFVRPSVSAPFCIKQENSCHSPKTIQHPMWTKSKLIFFRQCKACLRSRESTRIRFEHSFATQ